MRQNKGKDILNKLQDNSLKCIHLNEQRNDGILTLELNPGSLSKNMQDNSSSFEGWALALYVQSLNRNGKIILKAPVAENVSIQTDKNSILHYHRFLYRAMKFKEQFPWFQLSKDLDDAAAQFKEDLKTARFFNNIGEGSAGKNGKPENMIEELFADKRPGLLRQIAAQAGYSIGDNKIYRQLAVGLFKERTPRETRFFPGKKSAIDLWTHNGDTISIFELKTQNIMIGMVTELFFYANYIYDMFCDITTSFHPLPPYKAGENRGYSHLLSPEGHKIHKKVQAFFLYDGNRIHPLISEDVIDVLNQGTGQIQYALLSYPDHLSDQ